LYLTIEHDSHFTAVKPPKTFPFVSNIIVRAGVATPRQIEVPRLELVKERWKIGSNARIERGNRRFAGRSG
jgi:hypothetical protein